MQTRKQHQLAPMRDLQKARAPAATHATNKPACSPRPLLTSLPMRLACLPRTSRQQQPTSQATTSPVQASTQVYRQLHSQQASPLVGTFLPNLHLPSVCRTSRHLHLRTLQPTCTPRAGPESAFSSCRLPPEQLPAYVHTPSLQALHFQAAMTTLLSANSSPGCFSAPAPSLHTQLTVFASSFTCHPHVSPWL